MVIWRKNYESTHILHLHEILCLTTTDLNLSVVLIVPHYRPVLLCNNYFTSILIHNNQLKFYGSFH